MLPKGYLIGNVTADPTSGSHDSTNNYARFSVACQDDYKKLNQPAKTHFFNCISWSKRAQFITNYIRKGDTVFIEFSMSTNSYTNSEGKVVRTTDLTVEKIEQLIRRGSKNLSPSNNDNTVKSSEEQDVEENEPTFDDVFAR